MPVLFKNEYVSSLNDIKRINERYFYFLLHSPIRIVLYSFILLGTIANIINFAVMGIWKMSATAGIIYVVFIVLYEIWLYRRSMKIWRARRIELNGEQDINVVYEITEDTVSSRSSVGEDVNISLDSVMKIRQSKNLIFMLTRAKIVYTLRKDAFTVGTAEEFVQFMRDKGINAK